MARKRRKDNEEARVSYDYSKNGGNGSVGLSAEAQRALDTGSYGSMNNRKAQYNTSQEQTQQAKSLPVLKGIIIPTTDNSEWQSSFSMNRDNAAPLIPAQGNGVSAPLVEVKGNDKSAKLTDPREKARKSYVDTDRARAKYAEKLTRPSSKYSNETIQKDLNAPKESKRDKTWDKDFDEFYEWRYNKLGVMPDYDPATGNNVEHWEQVKKDIMTKNNWSEKEFDAKWEAYDKERSQKMADEEVQKSIEFAKEHPALGTVVQAAYTPQTWIEGGATMLEGAGSGIERLTGKNPLKKHTATSANDPKFTGTRAKEGIKQEVRDNHVKTWLGKKAYDAGTGLTDMVLSQALPGGAVGMGLSKAANKQMQALERDVDPNKAAETATLQGINGMIMGKYGLDKVFSAKGKTLPGTIGKAANREGLENVFEDAVDLVIDAVINGDKSELNALHDYYANQGSSGNAWWNAIKDKAGEFLTSYTSGAVTGGVFSGLNHIPELKDYISSKASKNPVGALDPEIAKILGIKNEPLKIEGKTDAQIQAEKNKISEQVNKSANGELSSDEYVALGETPSYLAKYGDVNNPLVMSQDTINKIAYPERYMGGEHNLGYDPIVGIKEQLDNPVASMKSNSQDKSGVVLTNYINADGEPVIAPIHMDKDSSIGKVNEVASMYGKGNAENFLNNSEIDFQNKERVDDVLSGNGLQLSELKSQYDPIFNKSIDQTSKNVNGDVPTADNNMGKSAVITNSAKNAGIVTPEQIDNDPVIKSIAEYAKHNNETTLDAAKQNVAKNGAQMLDDFNSGKTEINSDQTVDESFLLLRSLTNQIEELGENAPEDLIQKKNLLLSRLRKAGTKYGQTIQAFAKWNKTPDGALVNGERILEERTSKYKSRNKKKVEINTRIAKALEQMGNDTKPDSSIKEPKTREQIVEGIRNVLKKEFGSIEDIFTEDDINFLADLAENKKVPIWQITDEIEHRLNHGEWYDIAEEIPEKKPTNQKLQNALNELIEREPAPAKEPLTREQLVEQVRNTLDKESASLEEDFTDDDIEYIANLIQNGATKVELADALNTKLATGTFGISADTEQKVNSLFKYAEKSGMNSKAGLDAMSAAYKLIADETVGKATPFEKFEAWRYLAMLGNTKTMMRNMVGNVLFNATTDVSNGLSALIESGVDKAFKKQGGIQRQKAILNPTQDAGLIKTAWADGEQNRWSDISGTKYEKSQRDAIKSQKSVFDNRLLQLYEKATDAGISDTRFVHAKYSTSLAGYLKANGLNEDAFRAEPRYRKLLQDSQTRVLTDAERTEMNSLKQTMDTLEKARDYAVKQAEYATFHEDNAVAQWLTKNIQEARNSDSAVLRGIGTIAEGVLPFKKTPANILRSGFEYSPLGAIKSIAETGKLIYENTGRRKGNLEDTYTKRNKFTGKEREVNKSLASDVIESWSKTLTGSGLALLGYYLADKGILRASGDDDKYQNDLEGKQQYSIEINGKTYTVDWAAPAVMPMLLGAEANKIAQDNLVSNESVFSDIDSAMGSLNALLDPILETSFMQGVQNALESAANQVRFGGDGKGVPGGIAGAFASNALASYATQGIPTFLGQIARTVDPIRRATDTGTESNFLSEFEKTARKTANKIPFLSKMVNEPYYDAYGRTQNNSPFENPLANFAYQALSPSYVADINETQADKSARDAYNGLVPVVDENGNTTMQPLRDPKAFASWKNKVTINGKQLKPKEIAEYRKTTGETNYAIRTALAKEDWFSELSPTKQTEILNKVNNLVDKVGKEKYTPGTGKDYEAYKEGGIPSLLDYYRNSGMKKEVQEKTGLNATSNAAKTILADLESGNKVEAEQKIDEATQLADLGFTKPGPTDTYYKAKGIVPKLTPDEFARTYKAIDADGNQGIKQDEILAYLNKGNYTEAEGMQIWSMYAPKGKKVPYIKDDGTWGKH